jgi:nucleotide-binding universal stress UspA family protein
MRSLLSAYASRAGVAWNFQVVRGAVTAEVKAAAASADLIVLGKRGRSLVRKMGSTTRFFISKGRGMMLILEHGYRLDMPVTVFYDGSRLSQKALEAAVHLVKLNGDRLTVFVLEAEGGDAQQIQMAAVKHLGAHGLAANFRVVLHPTPSKLRHLIRLEGGGPVVLPLVDGPFQELDLGSMVSEIPNPVLLVR